jgi:Ni/Fe-hydrogenase subunit HybB-like protein
VTPFNVVAALILTVGAVITLIRFSQGLAATTNLTHDYGWGLWIGFDVMSGVALAAGGFTMSAAVYLFGMKEYKPIVRPALLTAFLGYALVVVGLLFDLGRPWRLPYPFIVKAGPTSALFEVALCVGLYLTVLFIESTPPVLERLGFRRTRKLVGRLTIALTIFGVILSTMHQSSLGALYSIMPTKLHPLWYSGHIPVHFFVSAVAAGISMVIVESTLSHRAFHGEVEISQDKLDDITVGLAKGGAVVLGTYFAIKVVDVVMEHKWHYLATGWGAWYLVEIIGFVLLPCVLFMVAYRERRPTLARWSAFVVVVGIVLNRLNVSFIAFNWKLEARYVPTWMEVWISVALVTVGVVVFRWIARRTPILYEHPEWRGQH